MNFFGEYFILPIIFTVVVIITIALSIYFTPKNGFGSSPEADLFVGVILVVFVWLLYTILWVGITVSYNINHSLIGFQ